MADRSFFRRLLGNRSDTVGLEEVSATPSPAGPIPTPYPNATDGSDPTAGAKTTNLEDPPDGTSHTVLVGEQAVADAEPTAFDEADAVFGQRTELRGVQEVTPTESVAGVDAGDGLRNGVIAMNGIISPNNVVDDPETEPEPLIDTGSNPRESIIGMNGIIAPNNVVDDPDDDLVLADLSGGSIGDQLMANTQPSFDAADPELVDDLDDPDDFNVD